MYTTSALGHDFGFSSEGMSLCCRDTKCCCPCCRIWSAGRPHHRLCLGNGATLWWHGCTAILCLIGVEWVKTEVNCSSFDVDSMKVEALGRESHQWWLVRLTCRSCPTSLLSLPEKKNIPHQTTSFCRRVSDFPTLLSPSTCGARLRLLWGVRRSLPSPGRESIRMRH